MITMGLIKWKEVWGGWRRTEEEEQKCLGSTKALDRVGGLLEKCETLRQEKTGTDKTQYNIIQHK